MVPHGRYGRYKATTAGVQSQGGAGLLEVLIAVVILSIGVLALGRFQGVTLQDSVATRNRAQALALARQKLESLRSYATDDDYHRIASGGEAAPIDGINTHFTRSWRVTSIDDPPHKAVTVLLSWAGMQGEPRELRLHGYIGRREPVRAGVLLDRWLTDAAPADD